MAIPKKKLAAILQRAQDKNLDQFVGNGLTKVSTNTLREPVSVGYQVFDHLEKIKNDQKISFPKSKKDSPEKKEILFEKDSLVSFFELNGISKKVVLFLFSICHDQTNFTRKISLDEIATSISVKENTIKVCMLRLKKRHVIKSFRDNNGRSGLPSYELNIKIFNEMKSIHSKSDLALSKKMAFDDIERDDRQDQENDLWQTIDWSLLAGIGFRESHLKQLARQGKKKNDGKEKLDPEKVRVSIERMAWGLEHNKATQEKVKNGSALRQLMGVLIAGMEWCEPDYRSLEEIAIESMLAARQEKNTMMLEKLKALEASEFLVWLSQLTDMQKVEIATAFCDECQKLRKYLDLGKYPKVNTTKFLEAYFREKIWPKNCPEIAVKWINEPDDKIG